MYILYANGIGSVVCLIVFSLFASILYPINVYAVHSARLHWREYVCVCDREGERVLQLLLYGVNLFAMLYIYIWYDGLCLCMFFSIRNIFMWL